MTIFLDDNPLADDVPGADAAEQPSTRRRGLRERRTRRQLPRQSASRDANPSDVIDRAIIVPLPDDDRDVATVLT